MAILHILSLCAVILKIMKDFNPNKTQLCITAASSSPEPTPTTDQSNIEPINVVSKSRTLKVMRSALAGLPILTPVWTEACLKEGNIVVPSGAMCVRTLPRKQVSAEAGAGGEDEVPTEHFGVAKYAAAFQKVSPSTFNHLLDGVSVLLCGTTAGAGMTKDLKVLLQQAGASIVSSVSTASRLLSDLSKDGEGGPFVFLCDDSSTDSSCGISDALLKQAKKAIGANGSDTMKGNETTVLCVHFSWLFDSISCAAQMKADAYEPLAPRAKALFDLIAENQLVREPGSRKESQIY